MAGLISVTPDTLRSHATHYATAASTIQGVLTDISRETSAMATDWQGAASAAYGAQFDQLKPQVTKFIDLMTQINGQLKSAADQIEQNDQQLSKGFGFK